MIKKEIRLTEDINDMNGNVCATFQTTLKGDGSTPELMVIGGQNSIIGYTDQGLPIVDKQVDKLINDKKAEFRARAIKEQKALCVENGVDPELVNIINAERKSN